MTIQNPADYYVHERGTTTGGTVYEPLHRHADPDDATTGPSFDTREEAQGWIDRLDRPFVMVRHGLGMHAANEPQVVGFLTEHGVWESMQRHGLRFSELRAHIADVKAGYIVTADDGFEWRLAD